MSKISINNDDNMEAQAMETQTVLMGAISLLSLILIYYNLKVFSFWSKRSVKGPTPWPIMGTNVYYLFRNKVIVDQEWREKYGRTYGIYDGYEPVLRTSDSELIKFIYIKNFSSFTDRNGKPIHSEHIKRWIFFSKGKLWNDQRLLITPMFTSAKMRSMFGTSQGCVDRLVNEIESKLHSPSKLERAKGIFAKDIVMSFGLDVISGSFFGLKLDTYHDKDSEFYKRAFAFARFDVPYFIVWILIPDFIKGFFQIPLTPYSKYEYFDKLSQSIIDERRKDPSERKNDFIQALLDTKATNIDEKIFTEDDNRDAHYNDKIDHKEIERNIESRAKSATLKQLDDIEIRAQMTFLFLAGFETTSTTLLFCFYELGHQQEAQEEVYQELIEVFGKKSHGQSLEYSKLTNLYKLNAFVSEILRLYSTVTEHSRLVTAKGGVELPTSPPIKLPYDCVISTNGFVLQRDPEYWSEPLKFDMSRFYHERKDSIVSCSYIPFGLGPRNCAGMRFALMTIRHCLAQVLLKYQVIAGPKSQEYPPKFNQHAFFLQPTHSDFQLVKREPQESA